MNVASTIPFQMESPAPSMSDVIHAITLWLWRERMQPHAKALLRGGLLSSSVAQRAPSSRVSSMFAHEGRAPTGRDDACDGRG